MSGLRIRGHEAQLTKTIASIAATDRRFSSAFVRLLLANAADNPRFERAVAALGTVPDELDCVAEHTVYDRRERTLGRVDLRFDGDDFTLLVENKLHSRFGHEQLHRYQTALTLLPPGRTGLVAVTRNVPSHSELNVRGRGWLGAVRWARLADGLRSLPIADPLVGSEWPVLIDVLDAEGDLGVTNVDATLVRAWARYLDGRELLADLLDSIRERALDLLRSELAKRYVDYGPAEKLSGPLTHGQRGAVAVKREQGIVWTGFTVPARERSEAAVKLQFWMDEGEPWFGVQVEPYAGWDRVRKNERQLADAAVHLLRAGFQGEGGVWWSEHRGDAFLNAADVPERLLELVQEGVKTIARSDMLLADVKRFRRRRTAARDTNP